jgi:cell division protein ZapA
MKNLINDRVRVQIFGREYEMDPGGLTALEIQGLADFVDQRMRNIAENFAIVDTQKIAVLAAINIALEYTQLSEKTGKTTNDFSPKIEKLTALLDQAINA